MGAIASQITSIMTVYTTVYSGVDQRKHQSSASLAFVRGIHRRPVNSPHKWTVTRKILPLDDVIKKRHKVIIGLRGDGLVFDRRITITGISGEIVHCRIDFVNLTAITIGGFSLSNIFFISYWTNTIFWSYLRGNSGELLLNCSGITR